MINAPQLNLTNLPPNAARFWKRIAPVDASEHVAELVPA